ncbi:MAG TPA: N-acetylmuramoyl-L-alanine amidase [Candidatus Limnocylindria bacterium]|nr:N-acetylmuramoyl-L-alanine amidase [Candidatus Limnocylindria bacterium]
MKSAAMLALVLCVASVISAAPPGPRVQKISLFGKEYIRMDQWARANAFQWKWLSRNNAVVWNGSTKMQFTSESRRMLLNGITVWLSEPARNQNGVPHLAGIDLRTVIQPVLFPPKNRPRTQVKHICIDPGHGGKQPGYIVGREQEKLYTLLLAQELGEQLRKAGFAVSFTRTNDKFIDLGERPDIARRRGADLFVSLHFNSAGASGSEARGAEVYCLTPQGASSFNSRGEGRSTSASVGNLNNAKNMLLAYEIQKAIVRGAKSEDRGVKPARFMVLKDAVMPAVLIEGGFMTNPSEARNIYSTAWRKQMAQAIVSGISSYRRMVEP